MNRVFYLNEEENAVVPNELLYGDENKYIWFDGDEEQQTEAQSLFGYLLQRKIYVRGFVVSYEPEEGMKMFNKPFFNIHSLDSNKDMVIVDRYYPKEEYGNCVEAKKLNPFISERDNIIIWGVGRNGKSILAELEKQEMKDNVVCFIDSNDAVREKLVKYGEKPILEPEVLNDVENDVVIIEALEDWESVDEKLRSEARFRRYHYTIDRDRTIYPNGDLSYSPFFAIDRIEEIYTLLGSRRIYVYGTGIRAEALVDYILLLDGDCGGILVDADELDKMEGAEATAFNIIENIIYEDNYWIWIMDESKKGRRKLKELGVDKYAYPRMSRNEYFLDVNLGFSWIKNEKCGIAVYGKEKTESYKIATLGGSTTDDTLELFPSWPEILHDHIDREDVVIYNAGCVGYPSSLEFLKLVRDILSLKPDMVISYSGFNDSYLDHVQFPYSCGNMLGIYEAAQRHNKSSDISGQREIIRGIPMKGDRFDHWLMNMEHMYAVTKIHGISFYGFLQPMLASKKEKTRREKNMLLSRRLKDYGKKRTLDMHADNKFRDYIWERNVLATHEYMYDLSHIFDDVSDVYEDSCHVYEKGNRIIASEIYKRISGEINSWERRQDK